MGQAGLGALLILAFLTVSLAPCPPRTAASHEDHASHEPAAEHGEGCAMHASAESVQAPCPCGCGERAPAARASARLGAALPSAPPGLLAPFAAGGFEPAAARAGEPFAAPIDHVPLRA